MAKEKDDSPAILGLDEIQLLDEIGRNSIPNQDEIVSMHSDMLNRTVRIRRGDVYKQASVMASNSQVAHLFGVDRKTMAKHFHRELDMGRAFARQKLITRFYHQAVYGNQPVDRIFALKNWANMSDNGLTERLDEQEEGVEFKVKRPEKPMVPELVVEDSLTIEQDDESSRV